MERVIFDKNKDNSHLNVKEREWIVGGKETYERSLMECVCCESHRWIQDNMTDKEKILECHPSNFNVVEYKKIT